MYGLWIIRCWSITVTQKAQFKPKCFLKPYVSALTRLCAEPLRRLILILLCPNFIFFNFWYDFHTKTHEWLWLHSQVKAIDEQIQKDIAISNVLKTVHCRIYYFLVFMSPFLRFFVVAFMMSTFFNIIRSSATLFAAKASTLYKNLLLFPVVLSLYIRI